MTDDTSLDEQLAEVRATLETALARVMQMQTAVSGAATGACSPAPVAAPVSVSEPGSEDSAPGLLLAVQTAVGIDWSSPGVQVSRIRQHAGLHGVSLPHKTDRIHRALVELLGEVPRPTVRIGQSPAYPRLAIWAAVNAWYSDRGQAVPWEVWHKTEVRGWCALLPLIASVVDEGVDPADRDAVLNAVRGRGGTVPHTWRTMVIEAARAYAARRWPWMPSNGATPA